MATTLYEREICAISYSHATEVGQVLRRMTRRLCLGTHLNATEVFLIFYENHPFLQGHGIYLLIIAINKIKKQTAFLFHVGRFS